LFVVADMVSKRWLESKGRMSGWACPCSGLALIGFHLTKIGYFPQQESAAGSTLAIMADKS
jgi:hypothetical protein